MNAWIIFGLIVASIILNISYTFSTMQSPTAQEEHPCLKFSDGKLAVITYSESYDSRYLYKCDGYVDTMAWFKDKGYHITGANLQTVYMER